MFAREKKSTAPTIESKVINRVMIYEVEGSSPATVVSCVHPLHTSGFSHHQKLGSRILSLIVPRQPLKWLRVQSWRSTKTFSGGRPSLQTSLADDHSLEKASPAKLSTHEPSLSVFSSFPQRYRHDEQDHQILPLHRSQR